MAFDPRETVIPHEREISLAVPFSSRDGSLMTKDSLILNGYIDMEEGNKKKWVVKRPGLASYLTFDGGGAGVGQGLWYHNGFLLAASSNNLTRISSPTSSGYSQGGNWTNAFNGTWKGRAGHATAVFKNALFVIGGIDSAGNCLADVWSSADGQNWQQLVSGAPWGPRTLMSAVVFNNRLYVLGGVATAGNNYNDVWVTDDGVTWTLVTGSAGWSARSGMACVVLNNGIWILGGAAGAALNDVWFSSDGTNWIQMVNVAAWSARSQHKAVAFNDRLYILGGSTGAREVWWSADGITWTMATNTAFAVGGLYGMGAVVYNGAIWAACGFNPGIAALSDDVWSSTDGIAWTLVTAAFGGTARFQCSLDVFRAPPTVSVIDAPTLYIMGGQDGTPTYHNQIWYSTVNGTLGTTYAIPTPAGTPEPMQAVPSNNNKYFVLKDTKGAYVWYANEVKRVTDKNYPQNTVRGIVNLDETIYVMDTDALIHGSAIGEPFVWPSRNFIGADFESDTGVAIAKYGNLLMALGSYTVQFFYNSGAPSATLLRPQKTANTRVGCAFPYSVVEFDTTVIWVGRTENNQRSVYMMQGLVPTIISTPWIDKAINQPWLTGTETVKAVPLKVGGHPFYLLSVTAPLGFAYTFAYDLMTKAWFLWNTKLNVPEFWSFNAYATNGVDDFFLRDLSKEVISMESNLYQDLGATIDVIIRTAPEDFGTNRYKFMNRATLIADMVNAVATIRYSDNDYQTWSTGRTVNLANSRATLTRLGRFIRRAWEVAHSANTSFRAELLNFELRVGNN